MYPEQTIYSSIEHSPSFQYSWDQALPSPQEAGGLLTDLSGVFTLRMTPQELASAMDAAQS
jgi:hypothetical protein